jgi:hypothetical protein
MQDSYDDPARRERPALRPRLELVALNDIEQPLQAIQRATATRARRQCGRGRGGAYGVDEAQRRDKQE